MKTSRTKDDSAKPRMSEEETELVSLYRHLTPKGKLFVWELRKSFYQHNTTETPKDLSC